MEVKKFVYITFSLFEICKQNSNINIAGLEEEYDLLKNLFSRVLL